MQLLVARVSSRLSAHSPVEALCDADVIISSFSGPLSPSEPCADLNLSHLLEGGGDEQHGALRDAQTDAGAPESADAPQDDGVAMGTTPDSPSKQLPDQISFFSGNPSVEIVHGIMHLYKTK